MQASAATARLGNMALHELPSVTEPNLASVELPDTHPAATLGRTVPVHGFLIRHPDGPILVDTGVGFGNQFIDDVYQPTRTVLNDALAERAVALEEVAAVVNSLSSSDQSLLGQLTDFLAGEEADDRMFNGFGEGAADHSRRKDEVDDGEVLGSAHALVQPDEMLDLHVEPGLFLRLSDGSLRDGFSDFELAGRKVEP